MFQNLREEFLTALTSFAHPKMFRGVPLDRLPKMLNLTAYPGIVLFGPCPGFYHKRKIRRER